MEIVYCVNKSYIIIYNYNIIINKINFYKNNKKNIKKI